MFESKTIVLFTSFTPRAGAPGQNNLGMVDRPPIVKSASKWKYVDLDTYLITLRRQSVEEFFNVPGLPAPGVTNNEVLDGDHDQSRNTRTAIGHDILHILHLEATDAPATNESTVDALATTIFRACHYAGIRRRIVIPNMSLELVICGRRKYAKANLCIVDRDDFILKRSAPNLPAQIIAAFNKNNQTRLNLGFPARESAVIPGITMKGQDFRFYKVPVSAGLVAAIHAGDFPVEETVVSYHKPNIPQPLPLPRIMKNKTGTTDTPFSRVIKNFAPSLTMKQMLGAQHKDRLTLPQALVVRRD